MKCRAVSICCLCVCVCVCVCVSDHCHHTSQTDECSVSGRNVTHALFLHTLFYQKTKQLPILMKCCEEIQRHQWKPPVEREEHRLLFWLKVQRSSSKCVRSRRSLHPGKNVKEGLLDTSAALVIELGLKTSSVTIPVLFLHPTSAWWFSNL